MSELSDYAFVATVAALSTAILLYLVYVLGARSLRVFSRPGRAAGRWAASTSAGRTGRYT